MRIELLFVGILIFIVGFSSASMFYEIESRTALGGSIDRENPSDYISSDDIHLYSDKLIIEKNDLKYASVEDTKSMEPLLSSNSHVIEAEAEVDLLEIGDIISFSKENQVIIHSIVEIGSDSEGWFALTKGYNNDFVDDWKVRSFELKGFVIGVLN